MMSALDDYEYLLTLKAVREQAQNVFAAARAGSLTNFDFHEDRLNAVVDLVVSTIQRDWQPETFAQIPPHGRWQHFEAGGKSRLEPLIQRFQAAGVDRIECTRRVVDLIVVSVLLDAGAGDSWVFDDAGSKIGRSEGLAVASLSAFQQGIFGNDCVEASVLQELTVTQLATAMQSAPGNELVGIESRTALLRSLGKSLLSLPKIFSRSGSCRPGNLVDYLMSTARAEKQDLAFGRLWATLQAMLLPSWPASRTSVAGKAIGDAWPLEVLRGTPASRDLAIQPFHKLTQWLAYSLTAAMTRMLGFTWEGLEDLTGLPEYRNGGLFVDMEVLTLKPAVRDVGLKAGGDKGLPQFEADSDVIVEWRAMTVVLLDEVASKVNEKLSTSAHAGSLSLAQILEAGTWKAGRELAMQKRSHLNACSPILIVSDGTLF